MTVLINMYWHWNDPGGEIYHQQRESSFHLCQSINENGQEGVNIRRTVVSSGISSDILKKQHLDAQDILKETWRKPL